MQIDVAALLLTVVIGMTAYADPPKPANLIDAGQEWSCYEQHEEYDERDRAARCVRSLARCEELRSHAAAQPHSVASDACTTQAKVAVTTYFDVMDDRWRYWALPTTAHCNETRKFLSTGDNKQISDCQIIGELQPPAAAFKAHMIDAGEQWNCSPKGTCTRLKSDCDTSSGACVVQPKAFAVTLEHAGKEKYAVFGTIERCTNSRNSVIFEADIAKVSACTPVGMVARPPLDATGEGQGLALSVHW